MSKYFANYSPNWRDTLIQTESIALPRHNFAKLARYKNKDNHAVYVDRNDNNNKKTLKMKIEQLLGNETLLDLQETAFLCNRSIPTSII